MLKNLSAYFASLFAVAMLPSLVLLAQNASVVKLPQQTNCGIRLDIEALQKSEIGSKLIELTSGLVIKEATSPLGIEPPSMEEAAEALGFHPIKDTRSVIFSATDFLKKPGEKIVILIELKNSPGNVETLMSSLAKYEVNSVGKYKIHSAWPKEGSETHLAIHTNAQGRKTIIIGTTSESVATQLNWLDGKGGGEPAFEYKPTPGAMVDAHIIDFPSERLGEDSPQRIIADMIKDIKLHVSEDSQKLNLAVNLIAKNDENAEQIDQMLQGLIPMVQGQVPALGESLQIKRDGKSVSLTASIDSKEALNLVSEQLPGVVDGLQGMLDSQ